MRRFIFGTWGGFLVKKGTPEPVVLRLNDALTKVMQEPRLRGFLQVNNLNAARPQTLKDSNADYAFEIALYRAIAKAILPTPQ
jgi:tripartite-type tricarboxylate transporter receptor subunit TctC